MLTLVYFLSLLEFHTGNYSSMRTRTRFLLLVLSVLVPSFIAAALAVAYVYRDAQHAQNRSMAETARAMALLVDNELETKEEVLRVLAAAPSLAENRLPVFYAYARSVVRSPDAHIVLFDLASRQLLNTQSPFGSVLPIRNASNLPELMAKYGSGDTLVSDLFTGQVVKRQVFAIQVPVKGSGSGSRLLAMAVSAGSLRAC